MTQTVSIHSYRGGTGKSNLVDNLAAALARAGQRVGKVSSIGKAVVCHKVWMQMAATPTLPTG